MCSILLTEFVCWLWFVGKKMHTWNWTKTIMESDNLNSQFESLKITDSKKFSSSSSKRWTSSLCFFQRLAEKEENSWSLGQILFTAETELRSREKVCLSQILFKCDIWERNSVVFNSERYYEYFGYYNWTMNN